MKTHAYFCNFSSDCKFFVKSVYFGMFYTKCATIWIITNSFITQFTHLIYIYPNKKVEV